MSQLGRASASCEQKPAMPQNKPHAQDSPPDKHHMTLNVRNAEVGHLSWGRQSQEKHEHQLELKLCF